MKQYYIYLSKKYFGTLLLLMLSFWNFQPQPSGQIELEITEIFPGQSGL